MSDPDILLGEVTVPSGVLTLLDPGHIGMAVAGEIDRVPTLRLDGLPRDRALSVVATPVADGRWAGQWDHVRVVVTDAPVTHRVPAGEAIVDFARLLIADESNAERWVQNP